MNAKLTTALLAAITLASCTSDLEVSAPATGSSAGRAGVNVIADKSSRTESWSSSNLQYFYGRAFVRNTDLNPSANNDPYMASIDYSGERAGDQWKGFVRFERGEGRNLNSFVTAADVYWPMDTPVDFYAFCSKNLVKDQEYDAKFGYFSNGGDILSHTIGSFGTYDTNANYNYIPNAYNFSNQLLEKPQFVTSRGQNVDYSTRGDDDFIYAISRNRTPESDGMLRINFRHAMSQLEFAIQNQATDYKLEVLGLMLDNVPTRGRFLWDEDDTDIQWLETNTDDNFKGRLSGRWFTAPDNGRNENFYWSLFANDKNTMEQVDNKASKYGSNVSDFCVNNFEGVRFELPKTRDFNGTDVVLNSTMYTRYRFASDNSNSKTINTWGGDLGDAYRTVDNGNYRITLKLKKTYITGVDMTNSEAGNFASFDITKGTTAQTFKKVDANVTRTYEWDAAAKRYVFVSEVEDSTPTVTPLDGFGKDGAAKVYGQPMFILPHQFTPWDGRNATMSSQARILVYVRITPVAGKTYKDATFTDQGYEGWVAASPITCVKGDTDGTYKWLANRKYRYTLVFKNNAAGLDPTPGDDPTPVIPGESYKNVRIGVTVDEFSSDTGETNHAGSFK